MKEYPFSTLENTNCTYTTSGGSNVNLSIAALMEAIKNIPAIPKIFTMPIGVFCNQLLPENFIILSESVAKALEDAIKQGKRGK